MSKRILVGQSMAAVDQLSLENQVMLLLQTKCMGSSLFSQTGISSFMEGLCVDTGDAGKPPWVEDT